MDHQQDREPIEEIHGSGPMVTAPVRLDRRYRRLQSGSLIPALVLAALSIVLPPVVLLGLLSVFRVHRRTGAIAGPIVVGSVNVLAGIAGVWLWTATGTHLLG